MKRTLSTAAVLAVGGLMLVVPAQVASAAAPEQVVAANADCIHWPWRDDCIKLFDKDDWDLWPF